MADCPSPALPAPSELLDSLVGAVIVVSGEALTLRYLNTAAEDLLRLSRERALGLPLADVAAFEPDWLQHVAAQGTDTAPVTAREIAITTHDGAISHRVDASLTPLAGDSVRAIELMPLDRHLRIARDEGLRLQERANRQLLRGVAHEIRNPLAGLRGAAQLLAAELDDASLHEYTDVIIAEADRLRTLIDRMVGPVQPPTIAPCNVHRVTEHVLQLLRGEAGAGIDLRSEYDPSIPELSADADQLTQALLNLGRNALRAVVDNGTVTLRTSTRRRFTIGPIQHRLVICIEVTDDGPGIPSTLRESLFQPMVSGYADGTGLGLTIAQSLAGRHGGLIECDSEPGATTFRLLLPLNPQLEPKPETGPEPKPGPGPAARDD